MSRKTRRLFAAAALLAVASASNAAPVANINASWAALAAMSSSSRSGNTIDCATVADHRNPVDLGADRAIVGDNCVGHAAVAGHANRAGWLWGGGIFPVGGFIVAEILLYLFSDKELHGHPRGVSPS